MKLREPLRRHWFWIVALLLVLATAVYLVLRGGFKNPTFHERFDSITAGMTEQEVQKILGPPGDYQSSGVPQVSKHAEVWNMEAGKLTRHDYHGIDVHNRELVPAARIRVWSTDEAVVVIALDASDRVIGKVWLTD